MAFTFSVIEWSSVIDPQALFRQTGQNEGDIGSGGVMGSSTVSFGSRATAQVITATRSGLDDFPDDNGARLDQAVTLNGTTFPAGAMVEADFEMVLQDPATGLYFRATWLAINQQPVGVSLSRGWDATIGAYRGGEAGLYEPGRLLTLVDGDGLDQSPNIWDFITTARFDQDGVGQSALVRPEGNVICFLAGTAIATPSGEAPIETLRTGDPVLTRDRGPQPLRWIGRRRVAPVLLSLLPRLRPIRIDARALGAGLPRRPLRVSPQHRLLVRSTIAQRMFQADEVLVAAAHLTALPGIAAETGVAGEVDYWHIAFDRHEVVWAEGAPAEALYPGREALASLGAAARAELLCLFPDLASVQPPPARPLIAGRRGRRLARRHADNGAPLLGAP